MLATASGIVSLVIVLLPTETQLAAYMVFGIVLGTTWASRGIHECLQGIVVGAFIGAIIPVLNQTLAAEATNASPSIALMVMVYRVALPAIVYFGLGSVPSLRS
jgi:Na+/H+ antiporter NhaA